MATALEGLASRLIEQLAGRFSQHRRVLRLSTPVGEDALLAESLRGDEGVDAGFRFQVAALALDAGISLRTLIGQPVRVELQTGGPSGQPRCFHGHATAVEQVGANGGFARYLLTIEPWTAFLALGRDSRVFQDKSVFDILDTVFKAYDGRGQLASAWRFDIHDRSLYPRRSLTTQYQESDLAFATRLMHEEGLFFFFEHEHGSHTLVIADHNDAFTPNVQANVRFTQPGAVMREDSLDRWRSELRLQTNAVEISSWDYRARTRRDVASSADDGDILVSRDVPGAYAYGSTRQGQRMADNRLQGLQARKEIFVGAGTVRTFVPGTTFTLHDHAIHDGGEGARFAILHVSHLAHNNLDADTGAALTRLLGQCALAKSNHVDLASSLHTGTQGAGERPVYRNRIDAIRSSVAYRPSRVHPQPVVRGQQTAIVVGPPGAVIHTDRDHRIKVQFHWQRGQASHSRLEHPSPDGHTGAPADDRAGTWVRVATSMAPIAGANWGSHALPRVGQEVLIDFLDGNIDRPVVIGAVYNGAGQADAQHNRAAYGGGAATGNAPMWFPGEAPGHAHAAVLSGLKTQAMQTSQSGTGAYSQLVFDDTPGEARVALQRHANAHGGTAELNLGHLRHQVDNQRLAPVGLGFELKAVHGAAVRAGSGMLLSADRASTADPHLDSIAAARQIEEAAQLQTELARTAQKQNARLAQESEPDKLPAIDAMRHSADVVRDAPYAEPHLQLSAPAGIAATTAADAVLSAGTSTSLAGQDLNFAALANWHHGVRAGISLFTYGKAGSSAGKPAQETGIRLHAASGKVSSQSQSGATRIIADKLVTVASVAKSVSVAAREHVLLTAQGAYLKLEGGNIEVHGPGKIEFKASMKELAGPVSVPSVDVANKIHELNIKSDLEIEYVDADGNSPEGEPISLRFLNGKNQNVTLDSNGKVVLKNVPLGPFRADQTKRK
ncbi:MAG: type VI secretion system Vgr family protein [Massilia sp.]